MSLRWYTVVVDCRDRAAQARWWAETLDWRIAYEDDEEVDLVPPHALDESRSIPLTEQGASLVFVTVPEAKSIKNRLHIDLAPGPDDDQDAAVQALLDRGATRANVGQGTGETWVVLADPEGNEFCVLSPRD